MYAFHNYFKGENMKNFSKLFLAALTAVSFSASAATVLLTTDVADPNGVDGIAGPNDTLNIVAIAKIKGVLEVRLSNAGLVANANEQRFAFGASATNTDAESFEIDPNNATLEDHVCEGSGTAHIQRLIEDAAQPGSCAMGAGADKKINASFNIAYKVDAAGGMAATLDLYVDNGLDEALASPDVSRAFLEASISNGSGDPLLAASLVDSNAAVVQTESIALDGDDDEQAGILEYAVEFDIAGNLSKAENRVRFSHVLTVQ